MPGKPGRSGGARRGTGPVRRRYTLSAAGAILLRELTRSMLHKRDVSEAELTAVLEQLILDASDARIRDIEASQV